MSINFISDDFERVIKINVIENTFPRLNVNHKKLLFQYMYGTLQFIALCYDFNQNIEGFVNKLIQNNYLDLKWLLTCLLPYIDQNKKNINELTNLNELYTLNEDVITQADRKKISDLGIEDINIIEPKYVFSNIQYGRFKRGTGTGNINLEEHHVIKFDELHLRDNYYLLLDTIKTSRNKLYINWIDILPYRMDNYSSSNLYLNTNMKFNNKSFDSINPIIDYPIEEFNNKDQIQLLDDKIKGLNIEDIYDTISLDLYESIVPYKWLIFDIGVYTEENKEVIIVPLICALDMGIIDLNPMLHGSDWEGLIVSDKEKFQSEWTELMSVYKNKKYIKNENIIFTVSAMRTIMKSIAIFFDKKYSKINKIREDERKNYVPLSRIRKDVDDYDEERMNDFTDQDIIITLESIFHVDLYNFFLETLVGFKTTWYSKHLLSENKTKINEPSVVRLIIDDEYKYVTYKNVYNYCKNLCHIVNYIRSDNNNNRWYSDEYQRLPLTWSGLDKDSRNLVLDRINDKVIYSSWFNIKRNIYFILKQKYDTLGEEFERYTKIVENKLKKTIKAIYENVRIELSRIIFESLISKGTLSYIVADNELTDQKKYDITNKDQKKTLIDIIAKKRFYPDNPFSKYSYYYLTNKPFGQTGVYHIKLTDIAEDYDYFKICSTPETAWYLLYAFHWIGQIGFCHRFIHNRICFITAGTGAGKSTQVPKLYMYYLKAIDHINDPTVIITVPRTNIATGVSSFVSKELAVPYEFYNIDKQEIVDNDNYYVQYKHMKNQHIQNGNYPKLRFITDGSVLQDAKDPLIKYKKTKDGQYIYLRKNKYDVVIVDEAHEHNQNMDMILSLMKNTIFYNNKMRLVIMSATIEADEPTYRTFYRDINDNRKYPLNNWIKDHGLDRINVDRRYHYSPPNQTTRYKIVETYRPGEDADEIVKEIVKTSTVGDILLFRPGSAEINKSVNELNKLGVMPDNVIAVPYYAKLSKNILDFIPVIDKNIKLLKISKTTNLSTYKGSLSDGTNVYTRVVIVATNIAEASITINSLVYVVDTGIEKTNIFDYESRSNVLETTYITEASRLQRKGRVGRVKPGFVFYTYEKGKLKNNIKLYNISIVDINQSVFLNMIRDPDDVPIFTTLINDIVSGKISDPIGHKLIIVNKNDFETKVIANSKRNKLNIYFNNNFINFLLGLLNNYHIIDEQKDKIYLYEKIKSQYLKLYYPKKKDNKQLQKLTDDENNFINNIVDLMDFRFVINHTFTKNYLSSQIKNEYVKINKNKEFIEGIVNFINDHYITNNVLYDYYGNDKMYDYVNNEYPPDIYFSGYDAEQLTDSLGKFYIIHPDELTIKRNMARDIVDSINQNVVTTKLIQGSKFKKYMISKKIIVFWETLLNIGFIGTNKRNQIFITPLGSLLQYCISNLTIFENLNLLTTLFFGYGLASNNEEFEKLLNVVCLFNTMGSSLKKLMNQYEITQYKLLKGNFLSPRQLHHMIKNIYNGSKLIKSDISFLENITSQFDKLILSHGGQTDLFKTKYFELNTFNNQNIKNIEFSLPDDLDETSDGKIKRDKRINIINDIYEKDIVKIIDDKIFPLIGLTGLDAITMKKYFFNRQYIRRSWNDFINGINNTDDKKIMNMSYLKDILKNYRQYMHDLGIDLLNGAFMLAHPYNIMKKISHTKTSYISLFNPHYDKIVSLPASDTYLDPPFYQDYVIYLSENSEKGVIGTLIFVDRISMMFLANIYNKKEIFRKFSDISLDSEKKHLHINQYIEKTFTDNNLQKTNNYDIRKSIPEHLISVINIHKTLDQAIPDIIYIQNSKIWSILENMGIGYENYSKILNKIKTVI